eukprot:scaffold50947_cov80-Phaeocystis_antarctica.AAC.2
MQLVHGGEVGHGVELDSESVHLQHELVRRLYQLCVRLLAERICSTPKPDDDGAVCLGEERLVHPRCAGQRAECRRGHLGHAPTSQAVSEKCGHAIQRTASKQISWWAHTNTETAAPPGACHRGSGVGPTPTGA